MRKTMPPKENGTKPKTSRNPQTPQRNKEELAEDLRQLKKENRQLQDYNKQLLGKITDGSFVPTIRDHFEEAQIRHAKQKTAPTDDPKKTRGKKGNKQVEEGKKSTKRNVVQTGIPGHLLTEMSQTKGASNYTDTSLMERNNSAVCAEECTDGLLTWEQVSSLMQNQSDIYAEESNTRDTKYKKESGELRRKIRELQGEIQELQQELEQKIKSLSAEKTDLENQLADKDVIIAEQTADIERLKTELVKQSEVIKSKVTQPMQSDTEIELLKDEVRKLKKEVKVLQDTIKTLEQELKKHKTCVSQTELSKASSEYKKLTSQVEKLRKKLEESKKSWSQKYDELLNSKVRLINAFEVAEGCRRGLEKQNEQIQNILYAQYPSSFYKKTCFTFDDRARVSFGLSRIECKYNILRNVAFDPTTEVQCCKAFALSAYFDSSQHTDNCYISNAESFKMHFSKYYFECESCEYVFKICEYHEHVKTHGGE